MPGEPKSVQFRFGLKGLISKGDPELLTDGQYRELTNMDALQEGLLYSRTGRRYLGQMAGAAMKFPPASTITLATRIQKLLTAPGVSEDPSIPSTNPRYIMAADGTDDNLYRTPDPSGGDAYGAASNSFWRVAQDLNVSDPLTDRFSLCGYSTGDVGAPWAYIASTRKMLRDRGKGLYTSFIASGTVNTSPTGNTVTWVSGKKFDPGWSGGVTINGVSYIISEVKSPISMILATSPGTQTGVAYNFNDILFRWGILPAVGVALVDYNGSGGLTGSGSISSGANPSAYDYRFTYLCGDTGDEGNPSQIMNDLDAPFNAHSGTGPDGINWTRSTDSNDRYHIIGGTGFATKIKCWVSPDPQITAINIYRRGGILFDNWRLIAQVPNVEDPSFPGSGLTVYFTDSAPDNAIVFQSILELDNDPPVPSTPPQPIKSLLAETDGSATPCTPGVHVLSATNPGDFTGLTVGSLAHIEFDEAPEDVVVIACDANTLTAFFQFNHPLGTLIEVDAVCGQPCPLVCNYAQFLLVAGDPNNPHLIYRSKGDTPESFPVLPADGSVAVIASGTPDNPIMNMCEFRGQILTINRSALYETVILNGSLSQPARVATRGMVSRFAWCKADNEVWFVSTDGVYSWDGGNIRKRSEAIDPLFHGQIYNKIEPVNLDEVGILNLQMEYYRGEIYLLYQNDPDGTAMCLKCNPGYGDRWTSYNLNVNNDPTLPIDCLYTEPDTGSLIFGRHDPGGVVFSICDQVVKDVTTTLPTFLNYTNDEYTNNPQLNGYGIFCNCALPWFDMGSAAMMKVFQEVWLEVFCFQNFTLTVKVYQDYFENDTASPGQPVGLVDTFNIPVQSQTWTLVPLLPNVNTVNSVTSGYGRECRAITFFLAAQLDYHQLAFRTLSFRYQETGLITAGGPGDWHDCGYRYDKRFRQMTVEFDVRNVQQKILLDTMSGVDGNTYTGAETSGLIFPITNPIITGPGRAKQSFAMPYAVIAKLVRVRAAQVSGATTTNPGFRILMVDFDKEDYPPDFVLFTPAQDFGHPYLKEGQVIVVQIDTGGVACTIQAYADDVAVGPLFTVSTTLDDWRRELPLPPDKIGRLWRLVLTPGVGATARSQLFSWDLQHQKLPPYLISFTPWESGGSEYDKYCQQIDLEVNTNGVAVTMNIQADNANIGNPIQVKTTYDNRRINFTMPPNLKGKHWRIFVDLTQKAITAGGGWFQLFAHRFVFQPADMGEANHSFDYDDQGYPYDKRLHVMTCEWDASAIDPLDPNYNQDVVMQMDLLSGIDGGTLQSAVMTFDLGFLGGRHQKTFPLIDGLICKKVRIYPVGSILPLFFKNWKYKLEFEKFPPDIIYFTEPKDLGWPYEKLMRNLVLRIDTGGVPCQVQPVADDIPAGPPLTVTTTLDDWQRIIPLQYDPNLIGKLWKLRFTPGSGGKAQVHSWNFDFVREPPSVDSWSSFDQSLKTESWKVLKEIFLKYVCASPLTMTWWSDTGSLTVVLPAHPLRTGANSRDEERYLFPTVWGPGANYNKSKIYSVSFTSVSPFKLYTDGSRLLWYAIGADRHGAYVTTQLSEFMQIPIGGA